MADAAPPRQLHLNTNVLSSGKHEAGWRIQDDPFGFLDVEYYRNIARIAERGTFDALFLADHPSLDSDPALQPWNALEPTVLLTGIAAATEHLGLIGTASTTFNDPYNLARRLCLGRSRDQGPDRLEHRDHPVGGHGRQLRQRRHPGQG